MSAEPSDVSKTEPRKMLLTGRPGCGKTTVIMRLAELLPGRRTAGFYTQEIRSGGRRTGFSVRTFGGMQGLLSSVDVADGPRVGRYRVDVAGFEKIVMPELTKAPAEAELFLIDEIGKMECFSRMFVEAMRRILDADVALVASVALRGSGFIAEVKNRQDVSIMEVSPANRNSLPATIADVIAC